MYILYICTQGQGRFPAGKPFFGGKTATHTAAHFNVPLPPFFFSRLPLRAKQAANLCMRERGREREMEENEGERARVSEQERREREREGVCVGESDRGGGS